MKGNVTKIKTVKCAGATQAKANTSSRLAAFHFHVHFHLPQSAWLTSGSGQKLPLDCLFITLGTALAYSHTQTHTQKEGEREGEGPAPTQSAVASHRRRFKSSLFSPAAQRNGSFFALSLSLSFFLSLCPSFAATGIGW